MGRRSMITWIAVVAGALVAIPALAALVGAFLPRDHTARMAISLRAGAEAVWAVVSDFAGTKTWRPDVRDVAMQADRTRFVEITRQGRTPFEIVSQQRPTRQVVRVVDDGLAFGGTWTWELEPEGAGTRLTITEEGFVRNPIFRTMSRLFFPPTATINGYLEALAAHLGEAARPMILRAR